MTKLNDAVTLPIRPALRSAESVRCAGPVPWSNAGTNTRRCVRTCSASSTFWRFDQTRSLPCRLVRVRVTRRDGIRFWQSHARRNSWRLAG